MRNRFAAPLLALALIACRGASTAPSTRDAGATHAGTLTITLIGTSDLHGHVLPDEAQGGLGVFAGYLANVRAARAKDGGGVLLVDAGDMFQGTLESNQGEGAMMTEAMNALGYQAAAIGNHEFDFGPAGEAPTPAAPSDDARGALKARAAEAHFPFLAANVIDDATGQPVAWPNVHPSTIVDVAGVKVGVIGVTSLETKRTTMAANVVGLSIAPLDATITREAAALRKQGATVVIVAAHAGGKCTDFSDASKLDSCVPSEEIMGIAAALAPGTVDAIVAGHSHQGMAHVVNGIPIIESFANGHSFGRIDLTVDRVTGHVAAAHIFPPRDVCARVYEGAGDRCDVKAAKGGAPMVAARYEGADVVPDAAIAALSDDDFARARTLRERSLGVTFSAPIRRSHDEESALGNLFADMMLVAQPDADVALTNGGGLRGDLPAGALDYGALYQAYPFDNRFARVRTTGGALRAMIAANLTRGSGIVSLAGVRASARCDHGQLQVTVTRTSGKPLRDDEPILVVTSDFIATGGDGTLAAGGVGPDAITILDAPLIRDGIAAALQAHGGTITPAQLLDAKKLRLAYQGKRPLTCPAP